MKYAATHVATMFQCICNGLKAPVQPTRISPGVIIYTCPHIELREVAVLATVALPTSCIMSCVLHDMFAESNMLLCTHKQLPSLELYYSYEPSKRGLRCL